VCLILISYGQHPDYPVVIAANRDEFYNRPTDPADYLQGKPYVLAGRDLQKGGTWLGVDLQGRIAAITNYRDPSADKPDAKSRGSLVLDFLIQQQPANDYLSRHQCERYNYNGFNLLVYDSSGLYCLSSLTGGIQSLSAGLYGISNDLLDAPWPKVEKGKNELDRLLNTDNTVNSDEIFKILSDRTVFADALLPDTGIGLDWERILSPIFVHSQTYGTRSSTVVVIDKNGMLTFAERSFDENGGITSTLKYQFNIKKGSEFKV
jgi:uncharacterized protein with NRDE domain